MTDRLTRRPIHRDGQITFYPICLEPDILGKNLVQVGWVIGEAIGENVLAGCVFDVVFELLPVTLAVPEGKQADPVLEGGMKLGKKGKSNVKCGSQLLD